MFSHHCPMMSHVFPLFSYLKNGRLAAIRSLAALAALAVQVAEVELVLDPAGNSRLYPAIRLRVSRTEWNRATRCNKNDQN